MKWIIAAVIAFAVSWTAANGAEAFAPNSNPQPFAMCTDLTRIPFDFNGSRNASACGLEEDQAFDVWQYFNVKPFETAAQFAARHDSDPRIALTTEQIERWIVAYAANHWSRSHGYNADATKGELSAAMDGLNGMIHGAPISSDWINAYGRFLRN